MPDYLTNADNEVRTYFEIHDIPLYFYQCFFGELIKVFGVQHLIVPDPNYLAEYDDDGNIIPTDDDYSYKAQIDYTLSMLNGTFGWIHAFGIACQQCNLPQLLQDYNELDWVHSDLFDGYITNKMVTALFDEACPRGYNETKYMV